MFPQIQPGLESEIDSVVTAEHTALHLGSGRVAVLATPHMIRLMETAAVQAVDPLLPDGYCTVGVQAEVNHLAATPVGMKVHVTARLVAVDGRRLTFDVTATDECEVVGQGSHQRVIVEAARFRQRVAAKLAAPEPGKDSI